MIAVVLGAAVLPDGTASPTLRLRVDHAVALYTQGTVTHLCLTGGQGRHGPPEAQVAADRARSAGVPDAALILEAASLNTYENIRNARALVPPGRAILISNRWHLPRARLIARILGWPVQTSGPAGTAPWPATIRSALREALATPRSARRAWQGRPK